MYLEGGGGGEGVSGVPETPFDISTCWLAAETPAYLSLAAQIYIEQYSNRKLTWISQKWMKEEQGSYALKNQDTLIEQSDVLTKYNL